MLEEGRISPALANAALERHRMSGDRFEEALIDCGLPESMLLRHLAEMFNTRFISTKTLSGALVPRGALSRLPRRLAERYQVVPLRFGEDDVLTVVATEPANPQLLENVRVAAGARLVTGLVARPAAISAAIAKLYGGDNEAFSRVLGQEDAEQAARENTVRDGVAMDPMGMSMGGGGMGNGGSSVGGAQSADDLPLQLDTSAFDSPSFDSPEYADTDASPAFANGNGFDAGAGAFDRGVGYDTSGSFDQRSFDRGGFEQGSFEQGSFDQGSGFDPGSGFESTFQSAPFDAPQQAPERDVPAQSYEAAMGYEPPATPLPEPIEPSAPRASNGAATWVPSSDPTPELDAGIARARSLALGDASKLAESLMIIHERTRGSLKSHSVRVARLSYSLCRQLDLSEAQAAQAWAIGLFHDLGKSQQNHLTALNVWQLADYEVTARAQFKNPSRLLKNADVPETVLTAILHMYERFDGKGFPDGLSDEAIPFQSRVVALCDSVADLTLNPANTLGRIVSPLEACNHIRAQTPKVFDPTLLAHFSRLLVERKLDGAFLSDQSVHGIEKLLG